MGHDKSHLYEQLGAMMGNQFDEPDLNSTSGPAFDWVAQELELPDDATRQALRAAFVLHRHDGFDKLHRALVKAWTPGARWPSGEDYLRSQGWRPDDEGGSDDAYEGEDPVELLAHRLSRVAHRIFRDAQVRSLIHPDSPKKVERYTQVCINGHHFDDEPSACGIQPGSLLSIAAGLVFLRQPAHKHPACDCTADPHPS